MPYDFKISAKEHKDGKTLWEFDIVSWWNLDDLQKNIKFECIQVPSYTDFYAYVSQVEAKQLAEKYKKELNMKGDPDVNKLDKLLCKKLPEGAVIELFIYEWESGY